MAQAHRLAWGGGSHKFPGKSFSGCRWKTLLFLGSTARLVLRKNSSVNPRMASMAVMLNTIPQHMQKLLLIGMKRFEVFETQ